MKFIIKNSSGENIGNLMRKAQYSFQNESNNGEMTFIRSLDRKGYPRFHIYLKANKEDILINLHLDQKRPIYKGTTAHSGEYEGEIIEKEAERIKQAL